MTTPVSYYYLIKENKIDAKFIIIKSKTDYTLDDLLVKLETIPSNYEVVKIGADEFNEIIEQSHKIHAYVRVFNLE